MFHQIMAKVPESVRVNFLNNNCCFHNSSFMDKTAKGIPGLKKQLFFGQNHE